VEKSEEAARQEMMKVISQIDDLKERYDEIKDKINQLSTEEKVLDKAHLAAFTKGQKEEVAAIKLKKEERRKKFTEYFDAEKLLTSQVDADISNMFYYHTTPFNFYSGAMVKTHKEELITVRELIKKTPHVRPFRSGVSISTSDY
jgi:DNA repair exonuclease SbcCD ATPase subunit